MLKNFNLEDFSHTTACDGRFKRLWKQADQNISSAHLQTVTFSTSETNKLV